MLARIDRHAPPHTDTCTDARTHAYTNIGIQTRQLIDRVQFSLTKNHLLDNVGFVRFELICVYYVMTLFDSAFTAFDK